MNKKKKDGTWFYCGSEWNQLKKTLHLTQEEVMLLYWIYSYTGKGTTFYASNKYIADFFCKTERTASKMIQKLKKDDLIKCFYDNEPGLNSKNKNTKRSIFLNEDVLNKKIEDNKASSNSATNDLGDEDS